MTEKGRFHRNHVWVTLKDNSLPSPQNQSFWSPFPGLGGLGLDPAKLWPDPEACHPISSSRSLKRRKKSGARGKEAGTEVDAMKKLLGDLKGVVAVVTAQAWEWQNTAGGDEALSLLCTTLCHWVAGLTFLPWFGKEQSLLLWVMELSILCFSPIL